MSVAVKLKVWVNVSVHFFPKTYDQTMVSAAGCR